LQQLGALHVSMSSPSHAVILVYTPRQDTQIVVLNSKKAAGTKSAIIAIS
jgi:hypothetical protein